MGRSKSKEFRQEAVRIALTCGLTRKQVASDLGIGLSTLNKWVTTHKATDDLPGEDLELAQENARLRREIRILKEERDILKKQRCSSRAKNHEVQIHRGKPKILFHLAALPGHRRQHPRLSCFPKTPCQPKAVNRYDCSGSYQGTVSP